MTLLWSGGEPIVVHIENGQPSHFRWKDKQYQIHNIKQHYQIDTDWWSEEGRVWRDCFAVVTTNGIFCVIHQDLLTNNWYLSTIYD